MDKSLCDFAALRPTGVADAQGDIGFDTEEFPDIAPGADDDGENALHGNASGNPGPGPGRTQSGGQKIVYMTDLRGQGAAPIDPCTAGHQPRAFPEPAGHMDAERPGARPAGQGGVSPWKNRGT